MSVFYKIGSRFSFLRRYHFRWVILIATAWTVCDLLWIRYFRFSPALKEDHSFHLLSPEAIILRGVIVFVMSSLMGYLLIFQLKQVFRDTAFIISLVVKTVILLLASVFMNFLLHFTYSVLILNQTIISGLTKFFREATSTGWLVQHSLGWLVLFLATQFIIEFYEKYSPGVFWDILMGKYIKPKAQKRIIMFMDLKDSTGIAEQLDSKKYFSFIRDFIYYISVALLEYEGRIYQYVGDEIVVSWKNSQQNKANCINALIQSARLLKRRSNYFKSHYGFFPEFKAGIHMGEVTVGEIGVIKKDIAMSGDTVNTAARIRTACTELNRSYLVSKDFLNGAYSFWPAESLGAVDLKGKSESIELYALKI